MSTHRGNTDLQGVVIYDAKLGVLACNNSNIAVGANLTCNATYNVTEVDMARGERLMFTLSATASPLPQPLQVWHVPVQVPVWSTPQLTADILAPNCTSSLGSCKE